MLVLILSFRNRTLSLYATRYKFFMYVGSACYVHVVSFTCMYMYDSSDLLGTLPDEVDYSSSDYNRTFMQRRHCHVSQNWTQFILCLHG